MGLGNYTICNLNEGVSPMVRQQIANLSGPLQMGFEGSSPSLFATRQGEVMVANRSRKPTT